MATLMKTLAKSAMALHLSSMIFLNQSIYMMFMENAIKMRILSSILIKPPMES